MGGIWKALVGGKFLIQILKKCAKRRIFSKFIFFIVFRAEIIYGDPDFNFWVQKSKLKFSPNTIINKPAQNPYYSESLVTNKICFRDGPWSLRGNPQNNNETMKLKFHQKTKKLTNFINNPQYVIKNNQI